MEKAILILDMPKGCLYCPVGNNISNVLETCIICKAVGRTAIDEETETIPNWCPLKPLPEKKLVTADDTTAAVAIKYGWNNCIDELLRKE